jgi:hypothetical protein
MEVNFSQQVLFSVVAAAGVAAVYFSGLLWAVFLEMLDRCQSESMYEKLTNAMNTTL